MYDLELVKSGPFKASTSSGPTQMLNSNGTQVAFTHEGEVYVTDVTGF